MLACVDGRALAWNLQLQWKKLPRVKMLLLLLSLRPLLWYQLISLNLSQHQCQQTQPMQVLLQHWLVWPQWILTMAKHPFRSAQFLFRPLARLQSLWMLVGCKQQWLWTWHRINAELLGFDWCQKHHLLQHRRHLGLHRRHLDLALHLLQHPRCLAQLLQNQRCLAQLLQNPRCLTLRLLQHLRRLALHLLQHLSHSHPSGLTSWWDLWRLSRLQGHHQQAQPRPLHLWMKDKMQRSWMAKRWEFQKRKYMFY